MTSSLISRINAQTTDLIRLFGVLRATASPKNDGRFLNFIELGVRQEPFGDEPGNRDVLSGVSHNGVISGSYGIEVNGSMKDNILISVGASKVVTSTLAAIVKELEEPDEHFTQVIISQDDDTGQLRAIFEPYVRPGEDVDDATSLRINASTSGSFGGLGYARLIAGKTNATVEVDGVALEEGNLSDIPLNALPSLVAVGKLVKSASVRLYRIGHPAANHLVQIGDWRGSLIPAKYSAGTDVDEPEADLHVPFDMSQDKDEYEEKGEE